MPHSVTIKTGKSNVCLPDGLPHKAGDVVTLTDDQFAMLTSGALANFVTDGGETTAPVASFSLSTTPAVTGAKGGNVALGSLITSLAGLHLITDTTS